MIKEISTDALVDPRQIGWVRYQEGDSVVSCKVIRSSHGYPFLSHPTSYAKGVSVKVVEYEDNQLWQLKAKEMLKAFRNLVGDDYYYGKGPSKI